MKEKMKGFDRKWIQTYMLIFIVIGLGIILSFISSNFLTTTNLLNVLRQISINGILAIGMTIVCLTGGIDLSVGSIVAFSGIIAAGFLRDKDYPIILVLLIAILAGGLLGLYNGYFVAYRNAAPFVVTLSMMTIARGMTYVYSNGRPISNLPTNFLAIGKGSIAGIPVPTIILILVFVLASVMLTKLKFGRYVYAVGGNENAAMVSGINVKWIKMMVYVLSGIACGIAAIILTARVSAGLPTAGESYELDAIAATVIGGTSLSGGRGRLWGTIVGAILLGIVNNGLDLLNVSSFYQQIVKGLIILGAILIDSKRNE
ncbi:ABC transporter permease [Faecalicatena contorta]|uniref:Monosaccharide ABC transporter membrane protein, CUT2 family n=1 Tax=Faecalicatena contorta TaxID=39482 RepID=A0A315ZSZ4_9FIRM|nr:ribose ABC transporter permease [Faecalicatena contorta]PWJ48681.1 monosaccharide ABC transporter membrane protein (CUT2 family) [Faecalicatena contorta]SUQ15104.1 monosaccharide ABC transporter membrane protein, CUT2 family [Faecalicatena contorta]